MKKLLLFFAILFSVFTTFAQNATDTTANTTDSVSNLTQTTVEKGTTYTLTISYTQSIDEAYFMYTINSALFEQGEAMKVIRTRINSFIKEHCYYFYTYLGSDITKYDNDKELATYTSHLKFLTENSLSSK